MYLGPDVDHPRWRFVTPGSVVAILMWLVVSGGFALYTSSFASYEKTWGSLTAVIVTLTWLWLGGLALLFGGELNAEAERSRELRQGSRRSVSSRRRIGQASRSLRCSPATARVCDGT